MKKLMALIAAALLALAMVGPALASPPPLAGNEGQPGHHGGPQHNP